MQIRTRYSGLPWAGNNNISLSLLGFQWISGREISTVLVARILSNNFQLVVFTLQPGISRSTITAIRALWTREALLSFSTSETYGP